MSKRDKVRDYISEHPGCTVTEIAKGAGLYREYTDSAVRQLSERGELFVKENEKGARIYALAASQTVITVPMPPLYVSKITNSDGSDAGEGWEVGDESGNIMERPFVSRQEARDFRRDVLTGAVQLGGSARYKAFWKPGERGVTQALVDAGKAAQQEYEARLEKWRAARKRTRKGQK